MVYDKIKNIELYKGLSDDIYAGLKYLKEMSPDIAPGTYEINPRVKAIVSEYTTKLENEKGYEAHQKNIDIQYLLKGTEKIACLPVDELQETQPYNPDTDAAFYESNLRPSTSDLRPLTSFALFFPQDAHMPQLCIDAPEEVKKVVIKVKI
jgi:YhcH/YjgK/YiaL family protein